MNQLDIFGGETPHVEVEKERVEQAYRDRVKRDPEFARRALILNCLNRRGAMTDKRMCQLLSMAPIDMGMHLATLRAKGLVVELGQAADGGYLHQAKKSREELT